MAKFPKRDCAVVLTSIQKRSLANATDTDFVIKLVMILKPGDTNDNKTKRPVANSPSYSFEASVENAKY